MIDMYCVNRNKLHSLYLESNVIARLLVNVLSDAQGHGLKLSLISSGLWPRQPIVYSREQSPDSVILSEVPGNDVLVQLVELVRKVVIDKQNLQRISYSYNMDVVTTFESRKRRKVTMDGDNGLGEEGGETAADRS